MAAFKFKVKTDNTGTSNDDQFRLPLKSGKTYNFDIDWGDGSGIQTITSDAHVTHTFSGGAGTYEIEITENVSQGFPTIYFSNSYDKLKLIEITQWGDNEWEDLRFSFYGCSNLTITATDYDTADFLSVTYCQYAWRGCEGLTSFPPLNLQNSTTFLSTWWGCTGLTSFPSGINLSSGTNFESAWLGCTGLTSFPSGINLSSGTNFENAWRGCNSLTSFPPLNLSSGTNFEDAWYGCSSLTNMQNGIDLRGMNNGEDAFNGVTLRPTSYSKLLQHLAATNTNTSVLFHAGNSQYVSSVIDDRNILTITRSWTITDGGEYEPFYPWPSALPQSVLNEYELQPRCGLLDPSEYRNSTRHRTYPEWSATFTMIVTTAQLATFRTFYDETIKQSRPFEAPWLPALGFNYHFVQFTAAGPSWNVTAKAGYWELTLPLDIIAGVEEDSAGYEHYPPEASS